MSDGKDELRKRFEENTDEELEPESSTTSDTQNMQSTDNTSNTSDTGSSRGPDKDPDSTRNRKQIPVYLPEDLAEQVSSLYNEFDGRDKVGGGDGLEKHSEFYVELFELALEHEDDLADRLDLPDID